MEKLNVLLITLDEVRKDCFGCYGGKIIETPGIDRLASSSIVFDKAYTVSPWCLPSRCAILTGLFPHNSGAYSNFRKCELGNKVPNIFNQLKKEDYTAAMIGKCHFAPVPYAETRFDLTQPYDEVRDYYLTLGIDHLYVQDGNQVSVWYSDDFSKELDQAGYLKVYRDAIWNKQNMKSFPFPGPAEWHPDSRVGRKAVEYIENCSEEAPQCIWVSFSGPHYPYDAPEEYYKRVNMDRLKEEKRRTLEGEHDDPSRIFHCAYHGGGPGIDGSGSAPGKACKNYSEEYWQEIRRNYYANVALIDDRIGEILNAAEKKFGENLLVIFTADHGELLRNHGLWGKNMCAYEDVLNVPLIVRYPGEKLGQRTSTKVMLTDIMPTVLKAAGAHDIRTDGMDFKDDLARGGSRYVFSEGEQFISVSDGRYKYVQVERNDGKFYELFDMEGDPNEFYNVINNDEYRDVLSDLRKQIIDLFIQKLLP